MFQAILKWVSQNITTVIAIAMAFSLFCAGLYILSLPVPISVLCEADGDPKIRLSSRYAQLNEEERKAFERTYRTHASSNPGYTHGLGGDSVGDKLDGDSVGDDGGDSSLWRTNLGNGNSNAWWMWGLFWLVVPLGTIFIIFMILDMIFGWSKRLLAVEDRDAAREVRKAQARARREAEDLVATKDTDTDILLSDSTEDLKLHKPVGGLSDSSSKGSWR